MKRYTINNVPSTAVKVTHDKDMLRDASTTYAEAEVAVNVADLRNVTVETLEFLDGELVAVEEQPEENGETYAVRRTSHSQISLEPNPRVQNFGTKVSKQIKSSLLLRDGRFHHKNGGVKITAESFGYNNQTREFSWIEKDPMIHGNLDGGHTLCIIDDTVDSPDWKAVQTSAAEGGRDVQDQFVRLRVVAGVDSDEVPLIAEALNKSVNVDEGALEALAGSFDFIKQEFAQPKNGVAYPAILSQIAFKQNEINEEGKNFRIDAILQRLTVLNNREFNTDEKQPYHAYWSRIKNVQNFIKDREQYFRLRHLIADALALPEYIILNYRTWYEKDAGTKFGGTRECKTVKQSTPFTVLPIVRPGSAEFVEYQLKSDGLAMPIMGALRNLVSDGEVAEWLYDPYKFLDEVGPSLVDTLHSAVFTQRNVVTVLKDKGTWKNVYVIGKLRALQMKIAGTAA